MAEIKCCCSKKQALLSHLPPPSHVSPQTTPPPIVIQMQRIETKGIMNPSSRVVSLAEAGEGAWNSSHAGKKAPEFTSMGGGARPKERTFKHDPVPRSVSSTDVAAPFSTATATIAPGSGSATLSVDYIHTGDGPTLEMSASIMATA